MWGNFSHLAKAAQELQEQASHAVSETITVRIFMVGWLAKRAHDMEVFYVHFLSLQLQNSLSLTLLLLLLLFPISYISYGID
jgi:hypothetical protein